MARLTTKQKLEDLLDRAEAAQDEASSLLTDAMELLDELEDN